MELGCRSLAIFGKSALESLEIVAKAGFTRTFLNFWGECTDLSLFAKRADSLGIGIDTLHAPFDRINSIWSQGSEGDDFAGVLSDCIRKAAEYGIPFVVMHTMALERPCKTSRTGIDRIARLVGLAETLGVRLAFENVDETHPLLLILDTFKTDAVGFCYDTGHENALTPGMRYMPLIGDRLMTTHLQDNLGIDKTKYDVSYRDDMHRIPFDGSIDFDGICRELVRHNYTGTLMLEVSNHEGLNLYKGYTAEEFYERAYSATVRLRDICRNIKNERISDNI